VSVVSRPLFILLDGKGPEIDIKTMFIFWNLFFEKLFFKFFYICLSLENLVNEKHFLIKKKFDFIYRKVFSWKIWAENTF